ncbi:MAG: DUF5916 domain-containing protein [Pseudomonadota bacterium]
MRAPRRRARTGWLRRAAWAAALWLAAAPGWAAFSVHRIDAAAAADGPALFDPAQTHAAWAAAPVHDRFFEAQPEDGIQAKVRTEVRLLVDARHLYVGLKAFDPQPAEIRGALARRDKVSNDQDYIGLYLDPSGAGASAQVVYVNAAGAVSDGTHSPADGDNLLPDFQLDAATARFDGGWSAVVRIPLSSIAHDAAQPQPWKLLVMRNMTREQRYRMYSAPVTRNTNCVLCFAQPVENLARPSGGLHWSATVQAVITRARQRVGDAPPTEHQEEALSLDLKLRPDPASIIDLTLKPDFSQVELDAAQLTGNTRFAIFVPEKRPFFLEGSDLLQTPMRAVHTRAITAPAWGTRYTRREAAWDLTLLSTRDDGGGLVMLPDAYGTGFALQPERSQATLGRALVKQGALAWGVVATDRRYAEGVGHNRVAGGDFTWQPNDTQRVRGQLLASISTALPDGTGGLREGPQRKGHAALLTLSHDPADWAASVTLQDVSDGFRADNGFFSQVGFRDLNTLLIRKMGKNGLRREHNWYLYAGRKTDTDARVIGQELSLGTWMAGPYDSELDLHVKPVNRTRVLRDGPLHPTALVGGRVAITPGRVMARLEASGNYGEQVDVVGGRVGRGGSLSLYSRLRPSDWLELEPSFAVNWIDGRGGAEDGQRLLTDQVLQMRGIVHFGPQDSLRAIYQHNRTRRAAALYAASVAPEVSSATASLVYSHVAGVGAALHAGLTRVEGEVPGLAPTNEQTEGFVKLSWQY